MALSAGATGLLFGGAWGAAAGVFISGGMRNGYRAYQAWRSGTDPNEASKSALTSAIGLAIGGYLGYTALEAPKKKREEPRRHESADNE